MESSYLLHPVYFPNIAAMAVLTQQSIIWELHDNFQKQTYRNRCYIATDQGRLMLNIPIQHVGGNEGRQSYKDVQIDYSAPWASQHWKTLQTAYRTSPFFEFYEDDIAPLFEKRQKFLMDLNLETTSLLSELLQVNMPQDKTEHYEKSPSEIIDYRRLAVAKQDLALAQENYVQVFGERHGFLKNLSTLDLLFNKGPEALDYLKKLTVNLPNA